MVCVYLSKDGVYEYNGKSSTRLDEVIDPARITAIQREIGTMTKAEFDEYLKGMTAQQHQNERI